MEVTIVNGDILEQKVDVIVNTWNRNIIPWWLLWPQGVSGAIKAASGTEPFKEIARGGAMLFGKRSYLRPRETSIQSHHSRCRHRSSLAFVRAIDSRFCQGMP